MDVSLFCLSRIETKAALIIASSAQGARVVPTDCVSGLWQNE
jgi:hypothetical protein